MKDINNLSSILGGHGINSINISNTQMSYRASDLKPYTAFSSEGNPYTTNNILQDRVDIATNVLEGRLNIYTNSTDSQLRINQNLSTTPVPRPCIGGEEATLAGAIAGALYGAAGGPFGVFAGAIFGAVGGLGGECIYRALTDPTSSRPKNQQQQ